MIIKWYNRDSISDVEMKQARIVAERLQGKKQKIPEGITLEYLQEFYTKAVQPNLLPYQLVVSASQYQILKKLEEK